MLHVPNISTNLISMSLLGKMGIKVVMIKNNVFVGQGYSNRGLFVFNIDNVMNENTFSSTFMIDSNNSYNL